MKGKFITFEGLDGSGKTTAIKKVIQLLNDHIDKENIVYTREPGGSQISENIREVILGKDSDGMDKRTEALLYAASRRQHLVEKILPALKEGKIVLCDRFVDSSIAYQGAGRGIDIQAIKNINEFATEGLKPDLTFYFDLTPEEGLKRIKDNRQDETNRLDQERFSFYYKVRSGYQQIIKNDPKRFILIDASKSVDEIVEDVISMLLMQIFDQEGEK